MIKTSTISYKHNKSFYDKQYAKYVNLYNKTQRATESKGYSMLSKMKSRNQFESAYQIYQENAMMDGTYSKGIVKEIVRDQTLGLKRHNAAAFVRQIKELGSGKPISVEQVQHMTHSEITELYDGELLWAYHNARAGGMTAKGAKLFVSQVWFGSD